MNCKPGDMARMVKCGVPAAVGLIVDVLERTGDHQNYGPMWRCKAASGAKADCGGFCMPGDACDIPDRWLRPIRPGDIGDEEVRELYSPQTTLEPA